MRKTGKEEIREVLLAIRKNGDANGNPIERGVITLATVLVDAFTVLPFVVPTGRRSIQLEWEEGQEYLELELWKDKITMLWCIGEEPQKRGRYEDTVSLVKDVNEILLEMFGGDGE